MGDKPRVLSAEETRVMLDEADLLHGEERAAFASALSDALTAVEDFLVRYVWLPSDHAAAAVALFVAATHVVDQLYTAPILYVHSAEKRSGKTLLLEVMELVVARPLRSSSITAAALFRVIESEKPTLLIDEVDTIFSKKGVTEVNEALRGILNAGVRRGSKVYRVAPKSLKVEGFEAFGTKVLAGINASSLPDTVQDRSIHVAMKRRTDAEHIGRFRPRYVSGDAAEIQERLVAALAIFDFSESRPVVPRFLNDRAADTWEPLLAIAEAAGDNWTDRARDASLRLAAAAAGGREESRGVALLNDIRGVFDRVGVDRIPTKELLAGLYRIEESPWGEWELSPRRLAGMLREFDVTSQVLRFGNGVLRGYDRHEFGEAWRRYPPPNDVTSVTSVTSRASIEESAVTHREDVTLLSVTSDGSVTPETPMLAGDVTHVTHPQDPPPLNGLRLPTNHGPVWVPLPAASPQCPGAALAVQKTPNHSPSGDYVTNRSEVGR